MIYQFANKQASLKIYYKALVPALLLLGLLLFAAPAALAQQGAAAETLPVIFNNAAAEFDVPAELLIAIAQTRSHLNNPVSKNGEYGIMQLPARGDFPLTQQAAQLIDQPEEVVETSVKQNIRGAAALLHRLAAQQYPAQPQLNAAQWYEVLKTFNQLGAPNSPQSQTMAQMHAQEVFALLAKGGVFYAPQSALPLSISPWPAASNLLRQQAQLAAFSQDYSPAYWVPAHPSNYTSANRTAGQIDTIVIHTMQGYYASAITWFSKPDTHASAHYLIRSKDGQITQMTRNKDIAWHAGHWDTNTRSIGIELEGFVEDGSWYTEAAYQSAARLVNYLTTLYHIPRTRQHIIGHYEVPGCPKPAGGGEHCHTDPGPYWNWNRFMATLNALPPAPTATALPTPTTAPFPTVTPTPQASPSPAVTPTPQVLPSPTVTDRVTINLLPSPAGQLYVNNQPLSGSVHLNIAPLSQAGSFSPQIYGVELEIAFDPSLLQVVDANPQAPGTQVAAGELFGGQNALIIKNKVEDGLIYFSASLLRPSPPISVSGNLLTFGWRGLKSGASSIEFNKLNLVDTAGRPTPHTRRNSLIKVSEKISSTSVISGVVLLQGRQNHDGITLLLSRQPCPETNNNPFSPPRPGSLSAVSTANGSFEIRLVTQQTYGCLQSFYKGFLRGQQPYPQPGYAGVLTLPAGDAQPNNRIDIFDIALIASNFGKSTSEADLNNSGMVDIYDLVMAAANYNTQGPVSNWQP